VLRDENEAVVEEFLETHSNYSTEDFSVGDTFLFEATLLKSAGAISAFNSEGQRIKIICSSEGGAGTKIQGQFVITEETEYIATQWGSLDVDSIKKNPRWEYGIAELKSTKQNVANVPWAFSRASIGISGGVITIGAGMIYIWVNDKEYHHQLLVPTSYDLSANKALVYNTETLELGVVARSAIDSAIMLPLFIHDGNKGIINGLLLQQELKKNINNLNGLLNEVDNLKHNNIDFCSRAKITYENATLTIEPGNFYFSCGKEFISLYYNERYQYTFTGSRCVVFDTTNNTFIDKNINSLAHTDILMLWYDGVKKVDGGLLLKYIKQTEYDNKIAAVESKIVEKGVSLFKADLSDSIKPVMHGGTSLFPQNNLALYKLAGRNGVLFWECDVMPCLDGFVLTHDNDIYQLAVADDGSAINQGDFVCSQKTIAELKTLKVGVKKGTTTLVSGFENERIPTLEEFLNLCKIYGACPVLEMKFGDHSKATELYNIVKRAGMIDKTIWLLYSNRNAWGSAIHSLDDRNNIVYCGDNSLPTSDIDEIISFKTEKNIVGLYYYISTLTDEIIERALTNEVMVGTWSGTSINNWSNLLQKGYSMFSLDNPTSNPLIELR
jgi:glycerophosphoryl diester phosphodiesterase